MSRRTSPATTDGGAPSELARVVLGPADAQGTAHPPGRAFSIASEDLTQVAEGA